MGLAEPKRKIKYSIDPNALQWANNDAKIGSKLMEKMGWEKGKGLGLKENGITENIKVKLKSDNKGVGYDKNDYDNVWLDHQDEFEKLLSNLKQTNPSDEKKPKATNTDKEESTNLQSLEAKSKQSKARLHYKKFARSKDLSSVSQNDLSCIIGTATVKKKRLENAPSPIQENNNEDEENLGASPVRLGFGAATHSSQTSTVDSSPKDAGMQFSTNKLSINDYFASKMAKRLNTTAKEEEKIKTVEQNETTETEMAAEKEEEPQEQDRNEEKKKKKKKKSKREKSEEEESEPKVESAEMKEVVETTHTNKETGEKTSEVKTLMVKAFKGSNLFDLYGYSSYYINSTVEQALNEKRKRFNRKKNVVIKRLEYDPKFYEMNKKKRF